MNTKEYVAMAKKTEGDGTLTSARQAALAKRLLGATGFARMQEELAKDRAQTEAEPETAEFNLWHAMQVWMEGLGLEYEVGKVGDDIVSVKDPLGRMWDFTLPMRMVAEDISAYRGNIPALEDQSDDTEKPSIG